MRILLLVFLLVGYSSCETPEQRARQLVSTLTLDEKISLVHGSRGSYVGVTPAIPRVNIPQANDQDGPQGESFLSRNTNVTSVGVGDGLKNVTFWPCTLSVISTWDPELMEQYAAAIGWEQRQKGVNIHLGPMVNIARNPVGGRNFESFGEDPHLSSIMADRYVRGVQSNRIVATVKHFVLNNQEYNRTTTSANAGIRATWEIYYPAFHSAVKAGVGAVMCSYNRINDTWACENQETLNRDLKGKMNFTGFVMSDWGATHSTAKAANNGLDQEMPDGTYFGQPLKDAVINGQVSQERLDDMVVRFLTALYRVGIMDELQTGTTTTNARNSTHDALSRKLAAASAVLLKNDDETLPIKDTVKKIAIIGLDGNDRVTAGGGGSGGVVPPYVVTPLQGIKSRAGPDVQITYDDGSDLKRAAALAAKSDLAVVFVSSWSSEGSDRQNLNVQSNGDQLIEAIAAAQPETIVHGFVAGAVVMPWHSKVKSIVVQFFPGQEVGNAVADVLFGDVNPSARLPVTFPISYDQVPAEKKTQYPGVDNEANYDEGLFVGYRWYDQKKQKPLYPFGHGLSYTRFKYGEAEVVENSDGSFNFTFPVANAGKRSGAEMYLSYPTSALEPPRVLRGFEKVQLEAGQMQKMNFRLGEEDMQIWNVVEDRWTAVKGRFTAHFGSSSRNLHTKKAFNRN
ncbi:hypothetical protein PROFUN_10779 [Planoprotostelium fungivorum]|uniref:Probable beta-glucosidase G n=1 Tax=Planoprotostelium fungivorum TaxID=1890364 RepID=A0A2P6NCX3_9EUKA|nr:hypothetical protein PROFUN_10779 [Planoprotostelium fungivorum]